MKRSIRSVFMLAFLVLGQCTLAASTRVMQVDLRDQVNSLSWTIIQNGFKQAQEDSCDLILLNMNTYGGEVVYADSIRSAILDAPLPVYVFINNNAASAGALISIACDGIYMKPGGTMGASTVVDQTGAAAPDKYQSYMRGTIRATAEAQGKDTLIQNGDTIYSWRRDPKIAEAMVDPDVYIEGLIDTGKVLTLTANEAVAVGYCDGLAEDIREVLTEHIGLTDYDLLVYQPTPLEKLKGRLLGTAFRAILIMVIVAGIWFELQTPGLGFPSIAALAAAALYFAPLYLDGFAQNWEILIFVIGVALLFVEIFVIPGFGISGILGILFVLTGLSFALVENGAPSLAFNAIEGLGEAFFLVAVSILLSIAILIWFTNKIGTGNRFFKYAALQNTQEVSEGFVGVPAELSSLIGQKGTAATLLRPSGKVRLNGKLYDAVSMFGFIEAGTSVVVTRTESGQLYVQKLV